MSNFNIGDKVVCVDDKFPPDISKLYDALPVKDTTYVVRDIRLGINLTMEGDVSVLLIGLVNPKADSKAGLERGFPRRPFSVRLMNSAASRLRASRSKKRKSCLNRLKRSGRRIPAISKKSRCNCRISSSTASISSPRRAASFSLSDKSIGVLIALLIPFRHGQPFVILSKLAQQAAHFFRLKFWLWK